jgi:hypothetical protein
MKPNPFHYLYVGERLSPSEFANIFSTELVQHALPLFQPGNVVLTGAAGMGKSMLFNLFRPEVRIAYQEAGTAFPVPGEAGRFLAAGININTAKCNEFGNRRTPEGDSIQELMFGDFFNYWVVGDMLRSLELLGSNDAVAKQLGISLDETRLAKFTARVCASPIWEGYLSNIHSFDDLKQAISGRILLYRRYMNGNDGAVSDAISTSKTSAGEPLTLIAKEMQSCGLVPEDLPIYILIDQYEELATITSADQRKADYRSVVNKVLNSRDPTLSFRIGTRLYGWRDHTHVFGTDARLEQERDYKSVELELRLRRSENSPISIFANFAQDVFRRRIAHASRGEKIEGRVQKLSDVFGRSFSPSEEARLITGEDHDARRSVVDLEPDWPNDLKERLLTIAISDPLSARLGEAWTRQKGVEKSTPDLPWQTKTYWKKERNEVALLQIAGRRRSRVVLSGEEDILALSGGNILIFLSICQLIWDFASQASKREDRQPEIPIAKEIQTIGIIRAGRMWIDRIPTEYGQSEDRSKLVQKLGEKFADILLPDRRISNPGQNGISISVDELDSHQDLRRFLIEAVDYGNLIMTEHANRSGRARRRKFYLHPLYCPIFRIPFQRTKEPLYIPISILEDWFAEAGIIDNVTRHVRREVEHPATLQLSLFEASK